MARKSGFRSLVFGLTAVWAAACGGGEPSQVGEVSSYALSANALSANALSANALSANALTASALEDPLAREFLKYVVSCALPADETINLTIDGQAYAFPGSLGMEPQWGHAGGSCDETCQRWITACVLARVDFLGVERPISVRGLNPGLKTTDEEASDYPVDEATYFGNVFAPGKPLFACLAPGRTEDVRVCGDSLSNCPMKVVGSCADACDREGSFGQFDFCSTSGEAHEPETYRESVTVFLPKSDM
jgi:hypothetical protein